MAAPHEVALRVEGAYRYEAVVVEGNVAVCRSRVKAVAIVAAALLGAVVVVAAWQSSQGSVKVC